MLAAKSVEELQSLLRPAIEAQVAPAVDKYLEEKGSMSIDFYVDQIFQSENMNDKEALITMISTTIGEQMGVDAAQIAESLSGYSIEELHDMMRSTMEEQVRAAIDTYVETKYASVSDKDMADRLQSEMDRYTTEQCAFCYDEITKFSEASYQEVLKTLGRVDIDSPAAINLYASSFENKDIIVAAIADYNNKVDEAQKIAYTDYLGIMMSSITTIINAITYVLIAFVAISLIVSSIMIGVITLISVQERTKEIGILRAIGASKKNVSSMFNAETMIIGFASGLLGVVVTYRLCIPINLILHALTGINNLNAILPVPAAVILVLISVGLTLISGLIPSRSAAKKDPVVALRTE
jgi:putative ABC transport system permease protein